MGISERRACQVLDQPRSTQRHVLKIPDDEERLVGQIVSLASRYGRYGYRRITAYVARSIKPQEVLYQLYGLFLTRGTPEYLRSDNGSEFTAKVARSWLRDFEVTTLYIEPGSPWENGYVESFIGKLRDEHLNGEVLDTLMEAKVLVNISKNRPP
jgi:IS30 family transposase